MQHGIHSFPPASSRVLPQARNRMTVQMAILHRLLAGGTE
jgi:hypothetical protein